MFQFYVVNIFTGEEMAIEGFDIYDACDMYGIDPDSIEVLWDAFIG